MNNARICEILTRMKVYRYLTVAEDKPQKKHQLKSYDRVITSIAAMPQNALSAFEIISSVPGIAKSMTNYLNGIFSSTDSVRTGIYELDTLMTSDPDLFNRIAMMALFIQEPGIGYEKANKMYNSGIQTLEDYEKTQKKKLTQREMVIAKYPSLSKRIPYAKIARFEEFLRHLVSDLDLQFVITGSYRRHAATSGDIDILLSTQHGNIDTLISTILRRFSSAGIYRNILNEGASRPSYIIYLDDENDAVQVDFLTISRPEEYPYAILYFTGSAIFNEHMKAYVKKVGYRLGNTEMIEIATGRKVIVSSEKEIFDFFHLQYVPPEARKEFIPILTQF